jgi:hypothetical protein
MDTKKIGAGIAVIGVCLFGLAFISPIEDVTLRCVLAFFSPIFMGSGVKLITKK